MFVLIDCSRQKHIKFRLFDDHGFDKEYEWHGQNRELLRALDNFFIQENISPERIEGIMVVMEKGSFTSTRIAATVANGFAYCRDIPLLAVTAEQSVKAVELVPELRGQKPGQYISASYSSPPNITGKNNF